MLMVRHLVELRAPFSTLRYHHRPVDAPPHDVSRPFCVWFRPHQYIFILADYMSYELEKEKVQLSEKPIGRAALMTGRIVWWLAREYVDPKVVSGGVSKTHCADVRSIPFERGCLADDALTCTHEDTICGTYHMPHRRSLCASLSTSLILFQVPVLNTDPGGPQPKLGRCRSDTLAIGPPTLKPGFSAITKRSGLVMPAH